MQRKVVAMSRNGHDTSFKQVFDSRNRRVRGLWQRNGTFYVQMRVENRAHPVRVELHGAETVPQAIQGMQVLKKQRAEGGLAVDKVKGTKTLHEVADDYLAEVKTLEMKRQDTINRESSCIDALKTYFANTPITKVKMADAYAYAKWRKEHSMRRGFDTVSGRQIDLDIITLRHVMKKAHRDGLIKTQPIGKWVALADDPDEVRLVTTAEVEMMRAKAPEILHNGGKRFARYIGLLATSGGREQETLKLKWSVSVDWENKRLGFGQAGRSKFGKKRWMPFNPAMEKILIEMYAAKKPENDLLFPSRIGGGVMVSYRKALDHVKAVLKIGDFGFHHLRHYFISHAVMSGVDVKTIADWVGHEDIMLISRIYGHISNQHSIQQAAKVGFGG